MYYDNSLIHLDIIYNNWNLSLADLFYSFEVKGYSQRRFYGTDNSFKLTNIL